MSKKSKTSVWLPPQFPVQGRLPQRVEQVQRNLWLRHKPERDHQDSLCLVAGYRLPPPCSRTLHISLFFDGTGNNLNNDLFESAVPHPTNIARLFRATIGAGHVGGTAHRSGRANGLTDAAGTANGDYYKYYMPGVGTPFPEVGDLDYTTEGLAFALRGEERINWGLLMIIDALRRALGLPRLDNAALKTTVKAMGTLPGTEWIKGRLNRRGKFQEQLSAIERTLEIALEGTSAAQPKLLGVRLYVYGFSRGAASARAFVNWLNELLAPAESTPGLIVGKRKLPVSVEYLGLLDTVVSVGLADIAPGPTGHMGWGDSSQALPSGALLKRCLHIVASHEQRLSFPLDSIRREDGCYPANSVEVIYPGVHSDQGGGYPPGDQGKAISSDSRVGDGLLLSQIALNDLYSHAFAYGAPFKVPKTVLPMELRDYWRVLDLQSEREFAIAPELIRRFNAWRQVTIELCSASDQPERGLIEQYQPLPATVSLEDALRNQMEWLTAWRIDRYAFRSLEATDFFRAATDAHNTDEARRNAEVERNQKQAEVIKRRELQQRRGAPKMPLEPGIKDFDPDKSKTQLREAAEEFGRIYRDLDSDPYLTFFRRARWVNIPALITYLKSADTIAERKRMKAGGRAKVSQLFPPPLGQQNHTREDHRGEVDELRNSAQPEGLLRALFDDQVHDSRAWFLHAVFNATYKGIPVAVGREPWGSYFSERMVFFGEANRRDLVLIPAPGIQADNNAALALGNDDFSEPLGQDTQRLAKAQKEIDEQWRSHYVNVTGGKGING